MWFQRVQDNENGASRTTGVATFASLATFLAGTVTTFQVVPDPMNWAGEASSERAYFEDTIRLRHNLTIDLGLRDEFTTGWNEESGRAANYITDGTGVLLTAPRYSCSVYTQNNATHLFAPRVGLAWDVFGNGKTAIRAGFGTYYSLIDDLSFPAEFAAAGQWVGFLLRRFAAAASGDAGRAASTIVRPRRADALHYFCAAGRPAQRANADG